MDLIRTGIGLTKTIKNVQRFREILTVFARHGFDELIISTNLNSVIPNFVIPKSRFLKEEDELDDFHFWRSVGYRLRKSFEELGPSFIKVGQLLASREDILDPALIYQLKLLQNKAQPIEFGEARGIIQKSMEASIDEVFESIDPTPIGVASIGVVYKAKLKNGKDVVVKVQRPNIKKTIHTDFEIIAFITARLEKFSSEIKYLGLSRAIDDFFKSIQNELNFLIEANNNKKLSGNILKHDQDGIFVLPQVYREYSSEKVLVMEFLDGIPFNEIKNINEQGELQENLVKGVKIFMHNMLVDGFFHADLHGGNFFKLADNRIGLIDFGLVGTLSKKNRTNLVAILYALLTNNFENLVFEFLDVADYEVIPNHDLLVHDIRDALSPFLGMTVQEMDATLLTHAIVSTLSRHQIYLPREWFVIFRSLMTLDGAGKTLKIDLNIFEIIETEIKDVVEHMVSKEALIEESAWLGRDLLNSMRIIPRHLRWLLKELARKKYQVDVNLTGINQELNFLARSFYFVGLMILTSAFTLAGVFLIKDMTVTHFKEIPILTYIFWGIAGAFFTRATFIYKIK